MTKQWHPPSTDKYLAGMRKLWGKKLSRKKQSDDVSVGNADRAGDAGQKGA